MTKFVLGVMMVAAVPNYCMAQMMRAELDSPSLGKLAIESHHTGHEKMYLTIENSEGKLVKRIDFGIGGEGEGRLTNLRFCVIPVAGTSEPLIVAIAGEPGGSDSSFEIAVLGICNKGVVDLIVPHVSACTWDAVFVCAPSPEKKDAVTRIVAIKHTTLNSPSATARQKFEALAFDWDGASIKKEERRETKEPVVAWMNARTELDCADCRINLIRALLPELM